MAGKYVKATTGARKKRNIAIILVALLLVAGAAGIVAAKYVSNNQKEAEIHASNFHFSSDYLKTGEEIPQYTVSDWGSHNVVLHLFNYEQENVMLTSNSDIQYKITLSDGWTAAVTSGSDAVSADNGVYTMAASETSHRVELNYAGNNTQPGDLTVTVESVSPYEKILKAKFQLSTKKDIEYIVEDKGDYEIISISTNDYYGTVSVSWTPENHSPDNTCVGMETWTDANHTGKLIVKEYTTYTLIFVENTAGNYHNNNNNAFTITGQSGA